MPAQTPPPTDERLAALARRQFGVASRAQLEALGYDRNAIQWRLRAGRLHRLHRGVYAVGHTVVPLRGRWLAAVLACGDGALLSHASAGALWGIRASAAMRVDVTVPRDSGTRSRSGIRVHRPRGAAAGTVREGVPVTTPMQTLADLAGVLPAAALERAAEAAEALRLLDVRALEAVGTVGARKAARCVRPHSAPVRSALEERFLALAGAWQLPRPAVNARVEGIEVDFCWPAGRLVVETDGHERHGTRAAFERDRERDARLTAAGWRVIRLTHRRLAEDADGVAALLGRLLRREPP